MNVLIVDDSALMRAVLRDFFERSGVSVVGEAPNGRVAVERNEALRPDFVTMDIDMPIMNGIEATLAIMERRAVPVIVFSGDLSDETSLAAFNAGAVDVVRKPEIDRFYDADYAAQLLERFRSAVDARRTGPPKGGADPARPGTQGGVPSALRGGAPQPSGDEFPRPGRIDAIVVGASTGGPVAVRTILSALPADFPVGIALVQHIEERFAVGYAKWLDAECALSVRIAREGERLSPGVVLVAPGDEHLVARGGVLHLDAGPKVGSHRPAVDRLFETAAEDYRERLVGVLLTGMGRDGAVGCRRIREADGFTIVQDEATSYIYGMPRAAVEENGASMVLPLDKIAGKIQEAARRG